MSEAPKINYDHLAPTRGEVDGARVELDLVTAERDRAQRACEQMGARVASLRSALLKITSIIETQAEPDIDAMHDVARDALKT